MKESLVSKEMVPLRRAQVLIALFLIILAIIAASRPFRQSSVPVLRGSGQETSLITVEKDPGRGEVLRKTVSDPGQIDTLTNMLETAVYRPGDPAPADALGGYLLTVTARYRDGSEQTVLIQPRSGGMIYTTPAQEPDKCCVGRWPEAETFWDSVAAPAEKINFIVPLLPEEAPDAASILIYANDPWHGYRKKEVTEPDALRKALELLSTASYFRKSDTASVSEAWRLTVALHYDNGEQHTIPLVISKQPDTIYVQNPSGKYFVGTWNETGRFWDSITSPAKEISREEWDAVNSLG